MVEEGELAAEEMEVEAVLAEVAGSVAVLAEVAVLVEEVGLVVALVEEVVWVAAGEGSHIRSTVHVDLGITNPHV